MAENPITWNATDIAAGVRDIRIKWINSPYYRNGSVEWNPLMPEFLSDGNGWQTSECPVIVRAPRLATQAISFVNGVAWDVHQSATIAAPQNELLVSHPNASPVEGIVLEGRESQVLYRDAITDGIDLAVGIWHGRGPRAEHLYVIRRMPSGDSEFVEIESLVTAVGSRVEGWDGASLLEIGNTSIVDRQDDRRGWTLRPAAAWYYDAAGKIVSTPIVARMEYLSRGNVRVTKYVPRSLIATALAAREDGELRCDLTGTFYPDANPETTSTDGVLYKNYMSEGSWTSLIDASSALFSGDNPTDNPTYIHCSGGGLYKGMARGFFLFDSSSLGATATITDAVVSLYFKANQVSGTFSSVFNLYGCTTVSNTGLTGTDYATTQSTAFAPGIAHGSIVAETYNAFSLNASGLAAISKTGITKLSLKDAYYDVARNTPPNVANAYIMSMVEMSENSDTSIDPKLVVTYSSTSATPVFMNHYRQMMGQ